MNLNVVEIVLGPILWAVTGTYLIVGMSSLVVSGHVIDQIQDEQSRTKRIEP